VPHPRAMAGMSLGPLHGQRPEQERIGQAEDRDVGPRAERDGATAIAVSAGLRARMRAPYRTSRHRRSTWTIRAAGCGQTYPTANFAPLKKAAGIGRRRRHVIVMGRFPWCET
jgi:hypothetical protein